jgi:hypothetical protein
LKKSAKFLTKKKAINKEAEEILHVFGWMEESSGEIWRCFLQKVFKNRNLKNKIANRLKLARKKKKKHMFSHFEKKAPITYKEERRL